MCAQVAPSLEEAKCVQDLAERQPSGFRSVPRRVWGAGVAAPSDGPSPPAGRGRAFCMTGGTTSTSCCTPLCPRSHDQPAWRMATHAWHRIARYSHIRPRRLLLSWSPSSIASYRSPSRRLRRRGLGPQPACAPRTVRLLAGKHGSRASFAVQPLDCIAPAAAPLFMAWCASRLVSCSVGRSARPPAIATSVPTCQPPCCTPAAACGRPLADRHNEQ